MSKSALVVDDSEAIQAIFSDFLESLGIQVAAKAYDGKMAAEEYQKTKPDIVFLDIMMPEYDGIFALKEIKKIDPNAKIIVITADSRAETKEKVMNLGACTMISKPFSFDDVKDALSKYVN